MKNDNGTIMKEKSKKRIMRTLEVGKGKKMIVIREKMTESK